MHIISGYIPVYFFYSRHHYYVVPNGVNILYNAVIWRQRKIMSRFSNFSVDFKSQDM